MQFAIPFALVQVFVILLLLVGVTAAASDLVGAGEALIPAPQGLEWKTGNEAGSRMIRGGEGAAMELRLPAGDPNLGIDHHYSWGETSPNVKLEFDQPQDWSRWEVLAIEGEQPGDTPVTYGIWLHNADEKFTFAFHTLRPGQSHRQVLQLRWYRGFDPTTVKRVTIHKFYPLGDERMTVSRLQLGHHAITHLWALRDQLDRLAEDTPDWADAEQVAELREQAEQLEQRYWEQEVSGDKLQQQTQTMQAQIDRRRRAHVEALAVAHAQEQGVEAYVTLTRDALARLALETHRLEEPPFSQTLELWAAGNERESGQVAVMAVPGEAPQPGEAGEKSEAPDLRDLRWSITPATNEAGDEVPLTASLLGYVETSTLTRYEPTVTNPHWRTDVLLTHQDRVTKLPAGELVQWWVTAMVPDQAPAGRYEATLTLRVADQPERQVAVVVHVWPFSLPHGPSMRTAWAVPNHRFNNQILGSGEEKARWMHQAEDIMLKDYHLDPGDIYWGGPPSWSVERLQELVDAGLPGISLAYLGGSDEEIDRRLDLAEPYMKVIDQVEGARDLCYFYGFDESGNHNAPRINKLAKKIHDRFPGVEFMTTMRSTQFGAQHPDGGDIDAYIPRLDNFHLYYDAVPRARQIGNQVWYYTCVAPDNPYPNFFIDWPLMDSRTILGLMSAKYPNDGFLYYATTRWEYNNDKIKHGPKIQGWNVNSYPGTNGDGAFLYPGPDGPLPSIRLEAMRDGLEDLAYYQLARQRLGEDADAAQVPDTVMKSAIDFTRDPKVLAEERKRLAELIIKADAP